MRMIAITWPTWEFPFRGIENVPEEAKPEDVFKATWYDPDEPNDGYEEEFEYFFIHPVAALLVNHIGATVKTGSDSQGQVLSQAMYQLCKAIEVPKTFTMTQAEVLEASKKFPNILG